MYLIHPIPVVRIAQKDSFGHHPNLNTSPRRDVRSRLRGLNEDITQLMHYVCLARYSSVLWLIQTERLKSSRILSSTDTDDVEGLREGLLGLEPLTRRTV